MLPFPPIFPTTGKTWPILPRITIGAIHKGRLQNFAIFTPSPTPAKCGLLRAKLTQASAFANPSPHFQTLNTQKLFYKFTHFPPKNYQDLHALGWRGGQLQYLGKLSLEIWGYQKSPPIGEFFGDVSESLHLLRNGRARKWASPGLNLVRFFSCAHNGLANRIPRGILFAAHCTHARKNLTNLRSKTCFQQVGRVSARKLKNVKAFCVNFT